jgi:hypothetical protein
MILDINLHPIFAVCLKILLVKILAFLIKHWLKIKEYLLVPVRKIQIMQKFKFSVLPHSFLRMWFFYTLKT